MITQINAVIEACGLINTQDIVLLLLLLLLLLLACYTLWHDITTSSQIAQLQGYIKRKEKEAINQPNFNWIKKL